jgi:Tol biopolymer transport system component
MQQLFATGHSELPHWSPSGSQVAMFCCDDGMAAHIVTVDTGAFRELAPTDPELEVHCGFAWSVDDRLACESFGLTDPSRTGVWSIRASDGGGLAQITSNPGGDDIPGDYSPDGKRLVFVRTDPEGTTLGIFVAKVNGSGVRGITPAGLLVDWGFGGSWSPGGNQILFTARTAPDHTLAIWEVGADGSGLHQVPIPLPCGVAFSDARAADCRYPGWSPDGTRIVFNGITVSSGQSNLYTVNADGSDLVKITNTGDAGEPDWGTHPLAG